MSRIPDSATTALNSEALADELVTLVTITDPATLAAPLRYGSSAAMRLSVEPLTYGIVSLGETYRHALRPTLIPDDSEDAAQGTTIAIDNVVEDAKAAIAGLSGAARVAIALVLASVPDTQFAAVSDLRIVDRSYDREAVTIEVSRQAANQPGGADALEPLSGERQTRLKAPGLHR